MNVWLCPVKARSWRIIKKTKMFGVPRNVHKIFTQVKLDDLFVFHVLKPINGIVAIAKVTSQMFEDYQNIWGKNRYPLRVNIKILQQYLENENGYIPLSALIGAKNSEIEIEPYLRNIWITKITKKQYRNLQEYFTAHLDTQV